MSTSPDGDLVNLLSRWLAGHVSDDDLRHAVEDDDRAEVAELRGALEQGESRSELQRIVRETLEELALG